MNIEKALEHLKWKFKNVWKPTAKDAEAINSILDYKELIETKIINENESLAKLYIHQLMLLNQTDGYSAERAIQIIDEILEQSVYEWCLKLKDQSNIMRFNALLSTDEYRQALKDNKPITMRYIGSKNIETNKEKFEETFKKQTTEENIIKFVESQITRIINKYEK